MTVTELIEAARVAGEPQQLCAAIPYAQFLGLSLERDDAGLMCRMRASEKIIGNPTLPAIHGGVIGALLEAAALFHLVWEGDSVALPKTINMSIDYLRSAGPADTFARGIITRQGRRVANVRAEAWQTSRAKLVAAAHGHFLIG
ncbi:MAG TPA: PaaI family thioesterase [Alphaproteobacteria bacterium]|nr:PaaI family thioesterase [Alphaproteobacteria bacterium]